MILIIDSGSTKAHFVLLGSDGISAEYISKGFNPYYYDRSDFYNLLRDELYLKIKGKRVERIYYYGAGCSSEVNCSMVEQTLAIFFPSAEILAEHDLYGAAIALFGNSRGIACILGTGSNSCLWDGEHIMENVPSLGYMLGDEGSGAYIGRKFLAAYLKKKLAREILDAFDNEYHYSLEDILRSVYNEGNPSSYMASFTRFLAKHEHHDDVREILHTSFVEFFEESVSKYDRYKQLPVSFVGSVAFHFRHILNEAAWQAGISLGRIEQAPMEGLIRFHS